VTDEENIEEKFADDENNLNCPEPIYAEPPQ
jgi:hypothetical protein